MTEPMTQQELEELKTLHGNRGNVSYRSYVRMCDLIDLILNDHARLQSALDAAEKRVYDVRENFMADVYNQLSNDPDNIRANCIIDSFDRATDYITKGATHADHDD
jgi:hypothetical protein